MTTLRWSHRLVLQALARRGRRRTRRRGRRPCRGSLRSGGIPYIQSKLMKMSSGGRTTAPRKSCEQNLVRGLGALHGPHDLLLQPRE